METTIDREFVMKKVRESDRVVEACHQVRQLRTWWLTVSREVRVSGILLYSSEPVSHQDLASSVPPVLSTVRQGHLK